MANPRRGKPSKKPMRQPRRPAQQAGSYTSQPSPNVPETPGAVQLLSDNRFLDPLSPPPGWIYNFGAQSWTYMGGTQQYYWSGKDWTTTKPATEATTGPSPDATGGTGFDWEEYFKGWGLPPDAVAQIRNIFGTVSDPNAAIQQAIAYVRGTPWYQTTYAGIGAGLARGVISDERDYRAYLNQVNGLYQRYYGRAVSGDEISGFLTEGISPGVVGQRLQGQAYIQSYGNDIQYVEGAFDTGQLSPAELKAYGEEQAGLDSPLGVKIAKRIQDASQRAQKIAEGMLATPGLSQSDTGLQATGLQKGQRPDIAA